MRHPALRRSARHSQKREMRGSSGGSAPPQPSQDPAAQNRPASNAPPDGDRNQCEVGEEGLEYQRDLGSEQDA